MADLKEKASEFIDKMDDGAREIGKKHNYPTWRIWLFAIGLAVLAYYAFFK